MKRLFFLFILLTAIGFSAHSQKVSLSGQVVDKQSGEPLPGATISIEISEQKHFIVSGLNGTFILKNLPNGNWKVKAVYVGYNTYKNEITVNGTPPNMVIEMERKNNDLAEVNVAGKHDKSTDASAMQADRKATLVQNSVSARTIEISPDLSVANVVQRISGVSLERSTNGEGQYPIIRGMDKRYIYTLVNGIKIPSPDNKNRYVPLDIFPADLLDRLEVVKSLTPDREGDAIGGAVNMVMKDAPNQLSVKANVAAGFAGKFTSEDFTTFDNSASLDRSPRATNGSSYQATMKDFPNSAFSHSDKHNPIASLLGLSVGGRVWKDKLGIIVAGSYQNNYRNVNSVFFGTETDMNNGNATVTSIEQRQYSIQQQRSGLHAKLDLKIDDNNKIKLYAAYLNLDKNEFRSASDTNLQLGRVGAGTGRISNSYRTYHDVQQIFNVTLNGTHKIAKHFGMDWSAVYSKASDNRPDEATLGLVTGVSKDANGALVQAPLNLDPTSHREFSRNSDEDKSGYLNFTYKSEIGKADVDWSVGGMYRNKTRTSSYDDYTLRPTDPSNQVYDGDISYNNFAVFNGEGTVDNALNYDATENVGAAYAMVKINYKKFELTGGARYENTDLSWESAVPQTVKGKTGSITYYDVLPSALLKYSLNKKQAIRLSYYSAISRPNFYEVIPHNGGDPDADYQEIGNPNLKRTTADNFDLRYEYFPKGLDQLLAGVFYKRLNNPIEYALENVGTNVYYTPDNFGKASNYGAELDITKYFRWFGVKANYTYTHSEITTSKIKYYSTSTGTSQMTVNQSRPLQGQSAHIANVSLLFKDDNKLGLNAQLALGYTSRRINTVSQFLDNDIWQKAFTQMDFSVEKKITKRWFVYAKVNNILNTPYQLEIRQPYTGSGTVGAVPHQELGKNTFVRKDTYGSNYLLGVKFKL
jgi:outer membrane receptor protein involved in Fe transport